MSELVEIETNELVKPINKTQGIITAIERIACNPEADIEKLERLWEMQQQEQERLAKMSYNKDMASLQSRMPVITKNGAIAVPRKDGNGNYLQDKDGNNVTDVRSKYSRYEDIMRELAPLLDEFGFSASFSPEFPGGGIGIVGEISHRDGHTKKSTILLPVDNSGSKNQVQAIGSTTAYGMRYLIKMMFNIADGQADDDGNSSFDDKFNKMARAVANFKAMGIAVNNNITSIAYVRESLDAGDVESAAQGYWEISTEDQDALFIAPTKGGAAWRTSDIDAIKILFGQYHPARKTNEQD